MNNQLATNTLAQIVNQNHQAAAVFEKYALDFCCKGKRSLQDACKEKQISIEAIVREISDVSNQESKPLIDFDKLSLSELVEYIVSTHHAYTKRELPQIFAYLQKVCSKHGDQHPELLKMFKCFSELKEEMEMHMRKEEFILFPKIKELEKSQQSNSTSNIQAPISVMEDEHDHAGRLIEQIREYSNNYTPPESACTTYRLAFTSLSAFEKDLHQHVHLENNILFPKVVQLFNRLKILSN
jgi:regulator of cell morphogenesis and NO signaling